MTKGLEALERLAFENACIRCQYYVDKQCWNRSECVWKTIKKELQALEIIKKYNIRPTDFHYHTTYNIYLCNMSFADENEIMSEEEYDLLKEVLL